MNSLKKNIIKYAPGLIRKAGHIINPLLLNFVNEKNQLLIFYFHGFYKSHKQKEQNHIDPQNNITINEFTAFIEYFLSHKYVFTSLSDIANGISKDRRYAMITFDDGYFNNTLAIDVLNK